MRTQMKKKERLGEQVRSRNFKILSITLSLLMACFFINVAIGDAASAKKEHPTKSNFEQHIYRASTNSTELDEYIRNMMFGRHNCMDSELGDLSDPGFPPEPTRTNESINIYQLLQEDISNYFVYQKEMHNRIITVAFRKDYVIEEEEKEYLSEFIFDTWGKYWKEFGGFAFENYTVMFGDNLPYKGNAFPTGFQSMDTLTDGITHEMYHAWNGGSFRQEGERTWFLEGVTNYCGDRLQETDGFPCTHCGVYDWYLSYYYAGKDRAIGNLSMLDPDYDQALHSFVANKGTLIAHLLDKKLEETGHHIGEVSRLLFQRYGFESMGYPTNKDILSTFNEVSGKDFTDFFNKYIYGSEKLPVPENFGRVCHDCTNPRPTININGQFSPVTVLSGTDVNVNISLNAFGQAGLNSDWWIAESNPLGWSTFVYPTGWQTGISPCIQTPLFNLIPAFGVPNNQSPEGNKTFYFAIDNNVDGNPDATWYDHVNLNVIDSIFPCDTSPIPIRHITIDGLADDWAGINPYIQDLQNDSLCGEGTDIKELYLATDGSNLFWRIDTWSGKYKFGNNKSFFKLYYFSYPKLFLEARVTWDGEGGFIETESAELTGPLIPLCGGNEYGRADKILEGKIPLRFFSVENIQAGQLSAISYILPTTNKEPPVQCDSVDISYLCD
jgi:hypothetical protein